MITNNRLGYTPLANDARDLQKIVETPPVPHGGRVQSSTVQRYKDQLSPTDDALALLRTLNTFPHTLPKAIHPFPRHIAPVDSSLILLQQLLETAPQPRGVLPPSLALHSIEAQRRLIVGRYSPKLSFDMMLHRSAQILAVASLLTLGYWFVDGPLYDWLHKRQAQSEAARLRPLGIRADLAAPKATFPLAIADRAHLNPKDDVIVSYQGTIPTDVSRLPSLVSPAAQPGAEIDFLAPGQRTLGPPVAAAAVDLRPTRLVIPSINVDTPVKEVLVVDDTWETADYAAGYMQGTGLPGDSGNMGISGHLGLRGGVFANLSSLAVGGDVYVDAAGWRYHYRVRGSRVVWPTEIEVLDPTLNPTLTLLTCTNWDTQRLAVFADLVASQPFP